MKLRKQHWPVLLVPLLVGSCGEGEEAEPTKTEALPAGVVARLGDAEIHGSTVERIAKSTGISKEKARERALIDAWFAREAEEKLSGALVSTLLRAALGRSLLESLLEQAVKSGPPTAAEIDQLTLDRWVELDRPASARVTHAVVLAQEGSDRQVARRVAEAIASAVRGTSDPDSFATAAKAVSADGVTVKVESLPAMTPSGRAFSLGGDPIRISQNFDRTFAEAANAIANPGGQSDIVETRFGFHVILLEEKIPELRVPLEDRRRILEKEVMARRAAELRRNVVEASRSRTPVDVARDFDARTSGIEGF